MARLEIKVRDELRARKKFKACNKLGAHLGIRFMGAWILKAQRRANIYGAHMCTCFSTSS